MINEKNLIIFFFFFRYGGIPIQIVATAFASQIRTFRQQRPAAEQTPPTVGLRQRRRTERGAAGTVEPAGRVRPTLSQEPTGPALPRRAQLEQE